MSIGGVGLEVEYSSTSVKKKGKAASKKPAAAVKKVIIPQEEVTAHINPKTCVNCGTCREICPVGAIKENQRIICHGCPVCTEKPGISPQKMEELSTSVSCTTACPLNISPQGYIGLTKAGKYEEAFNIIWEKNPLPSVCGSVCHHPCEDSCMRGILVDMPIKIRDIKKYLAENVDAQVKPYTVVYDEKIAIIGAGPAGLTAGHYLAQAGYDVTVFEGDAEAGGMLKRGIPEFRLNREVIDRDIQKLQAAGLKIVLDFRIDRYMLEEIKEEFDVVIVATGTPQSKELNIPGRQLTGVMSAMNFMDNVNNGVELCRHLGQVFKFKQGEGVVIGGGSVAVDVARTALRTGAAKVTVVCLESDDAVPAHQWEIDEAKQEGVTFIEGYSPLEYMSNLFPALEGVKFAKVKSFKKDKNGKISFDVDKKDVLEIKTDWVVEAIGQQADALWQNQTEENIFFAGDIETNNCSVVDAMASGRKAAIAVDAALRGRAVKDPMKKQELAMADVMEKIFPYNRRKTVRPEYAEHTLNESQVTQETQSCLACGFEVVDQAECIACGLCQKLCPAGNVITMIAKEGGKA